MRRIIFTAAISIVAVVSISFTQPISDTKRILSQVSPSIVMVTRPMPDDKVSICTGFVINALTKRVLTAQHCVVNEEGTVTPIFVDTLPAHVVKTDKWLALVNVPTLNKPSVEMEKSPVMIGDLTYALGFGQGFPTILLRPIVWIFHDGKKYQDAIVVDGLFIQGMSGGPIVNISGRVIGVVQRGDDVFGYASGPGAIKAFLK